MNPGRRRPPHRRRMHRRAVPSSSSATPAGHRPWPRDRHDLPFREPAAVPFCIPLGGGTVAESDLLPAVHVHDLDSRGAPPLRTDRNSALAPTQKPSGQFASANRWPSGLTNLKPGRPHLTGHRNRRSLPDDGDWVVGSIEEEPAAPRVRGIDAPQWESRIGRGGPGTSRSRSRSPQRLDPRARFRSGHVR